MDKKSRRSLLVRNLKYETSPAQVREAFEQFGQIRDVYLPLDHDLGKPRGFGFVEFFNERDAESAQREMDKTTLHGNEISCIIAQDRRKSPRTMKSLTDQKKTGSYPRRRYGSSPPRGRSYSPSPMRRRGSRSISPGGRGRSRDYYPRNARRRSYSRSRSYDHGRRRGYREPSGGYSRGGGGGAAYYDRGVGRSTSDRHNPVGEERRGERYQGAPSCGYRYGAGPPERYNDRYSDNRSLDGDRYGNGSSRQGCPSMMSGVGMSSDGMIDPMMRMNSPPPMNPYAQPSHDPNPDMDPM